MLPEKIALEVEHLRKKAVEASKEGNMQLAIDTLNEAWLLLPEPRTDQAESFTITQYLVSLFLKHKDLEQAYVMAGRLQNCDLQRQDIGEREFHLGRVLFERDDKAEAFRIFLIADQKSEGRIWRLSTAQLYREFFRSMRKGQ